MRSPAFLLYVAVGAIGTGVHYSILLISVLSGLANPVVGSSVGAAIGAIANYALNYHFTFPGNKRHISAAPRFFLVALIGLGINWLVMECLIYLLNTHYLAAQCAATASVLLITFSANRMWSFKTEPYGTTNC